ncbi:MAG: transposase [Caldilineaceae bacterium SB0661_bin_34]|nr:transposase [Caldilineaceae bacterium SB0661_bin_34]
MQRGRRRGSVASPCPWSLGPGHTHQRTGTCTRTPKFALVLTHARPGARDSPRRVTHPLPDIPGRKVKQKLGLNRSILASGWGSLERKLEYKAGELRKVAPAYTSQTCSRCSHVHRDNRPSQAVFACGACGFRANADHNAAINILVRAGLPCVPVSARGTGAAARRGAIPSGTPTTRERDGPAVKSGL